MSPWRIGRLCTMQGRCAVVKCWGITASRLPQPQQFYDGVVAAMLSQYAEVNSSRVHCPVVFLFLVFFVCRHRGFYAAKLRTMTMMELISSSSPVRFNWSNWRNALSQVNEKRCLSFLSFLLDDNNENGA